MARCYQCFRICRVGSGSLWRGIDWNRAASWIGASDMRGIPMRCGACKSWIVWGIEKRQATSLQRAIRREGHVRIRAVRTFLTCPYADNWLPKRYKTLRARADRNTADIQRWRASCCDSVLKHYRQIFWNGIMIYDVPEKHAIPIAWKLVRAWRSFLRTRHPLDMLEHFRGGRREGTVW